MCAALLIYANVDALGLGLPLFPPSLPPFLPLVLSLLPVPPSTASLQETQDILEDTKDKCSEFGQVNGALVVKVLLACVFVQSVDRRCGSEGAWEKGGDMERRDTVLFQQLQDVLDALKTLKPKFGNEILDLEG